MAVKMSGKFHSFLFIPLKTALEYHHTESHWDEKGNNQVERFWKYSWLLSLKARIL